MTETLTESFCERCGTRYTFESARPRVRLKGVKVLSRGLKNFVLSDGSTMDEAMAAARNETDRELTSHQLDAFHATFNFCMSCRQYTCPNCWNEAEARCLTCAPRLGLEAMPAPFPDLPAATVMISDPVGASGKNGSPHQATDRSDDEIDFAARLAMLTGADVATGDAMAIEESPGAVADEPSEADAPAGEVAAGVQPVVPEMAVPSLEATLLDAEDAPPTPAWLAALAAGAAAASRDEREAGRDVGELTPPQKGGLRERIRPEAEPPAEPARPLDAAAVELEPTEAPLAGIEGAIAIEAAPQAAAELEAAHDVEAATQAAAELQAAAQLQTAQATAQAKAEREAGELDAARIAAALAAAARVDGEREAAARVQAEREAAEREAAARVEAAAREEADRQAARAAELEAARAAELEAAARAESERQAAELEAEAARRDAAETEAAAAAAAAARADDIVQQPTWRMVAPDPSDEVSIAQPGDPGGATPPPARDPNAEPQWPSRPGAIASGLPFLGRAPAPQGGLEALWAESNREVVSRPLVAGKSVTGGVQPCLSCGLSLSANARFCRRCGTPQAS